MKRLTKEDRLELINDHRMAVGRNPFKTLNDEQMKKHEKLIDKNAPYGNDPWGR